jgi:hypothetical protein
LLGLATAVETVRVGEGEGEDPESCGLGMAATKPTPRRTVFRSIAQLILDVLLGNEREGELRKRGYSTSCFIYLPT